MSTWYLIDTSLADGITAAVVSPSHPSSAGHWVAGPDKVQLIVATKRWNVLYMPASDKVRLKTKDELDLDAQQMVTQQAGLLGAQEALNVLAPRWDSEKDILGYITANVKNLQDAISLMSEMAGIVAHLLRLVRRG